MSNKTEKRGFEKEFLEQTIEEEKKERKSFYNEEKNKIIILSLAIISIAGFAVSVLFLIGITGAAIGPSRGNLWGLIFIIISLLIWVIAEVLWIKEKKNKEVDIKKILENLEKEGLPMIYKKSD